MAKCSMQKKIESLSKLKESKLNESSFTGEMTYSIRAVKRDGEKYPLKKYVYNNINTAGAFYRALDEIIGGLESQPVIVDAELAAAVRGVLYLKTAVDGVSWDITVDVTLNVDPVVVAADALSLQLPADIKY